MNTQKKLVQSDKPKQPEVTTLTELFTYPARAYEVLSALEEKGFRGAKIVGYGEVPTQPIQQNGWELSVVKEVHPKAKTRVQALLDRGIPIEHYIYAHELEVERRDFKVSPPDILPAVTTLGAVVGLAATALAFGFLQALMGLDPAFLVVVREDNGVLVWVEVCNWI